MLKVNYEYLGGVLFVRLDGNLDSRNIYLLIDSIKNVIKIGGIKYVVINVEKVKILNDNYIKYMIEDIKTSSIYLCGYKSSNYNSNILLNDEKHIFKYINY